MQERGIAVLFVTVFVFWVLLNGAVTADIVVVGILASLAIAALFPGSLSPISEFRASPAAVAAAGRYLVYFLAELVKSNLKLAGIVLKPNLPINPGIVRVRTRLKSKMGRLLLANSITLTPGTLSVNLEGEWLYVHWVTVEAETTEVATDRIVAGFERYLEVMYG